MFFFKREREIKNLIKAFVNKVNEYEPQDEDDEFFADSILVKKSNSGFRMVYDFEKENAIIEYDLNESKRNPIGDKLFYENFCKICPFAILLSSTTLSLLHEVGHIKTENELPSDYDRDELIDNICNDFESDDMRNSLYFELPDEKLATEWAVKWLSDVSHRVIAYNFDDNIKSLISTKKE